VSVPAAADFLTGAERKAVADAIGAAERRTSGEIRVHLEDHIDEEILEHAAFIFGELGMHRTRDRNGVLIYVCVADRKVAVIGDKGINDVVPAGFWNDVIARSVAHFAAGRPGQGLCDAVTMVGEKLVQFHPLKSDDRNELSNEVSIGGL